MNRQVIRNHFYRLNILALLYFSPATLFFRINALPWYAGTLQVWLDALGYRSGDAILEVGCATGQLTRYLARHGAVVHGVDNSPKMLRKANASATEGASFVLASATDLPFENHRFDYIVAASLINIISEPETALREMARVCKPGGKVSVLVPQKGMADVETLADHLNLSGFSRAALMAWHRHAPKMEPRKLLEYFGNAGLQAKHVETHLSGMVMTVTGIRL